MFIDGNRLNFLAEHHLHPFQLAQPCGRILQGSACTNIQITYPSAFRLVIEHQVQGSRTHLFNAALGFHALMTLVYLHILHLVGL